MQKSCKKLTSFFLQGIKYLKSNEAQYKYFYVTRFFVFLYKFQNI